MPINKYSILDAVRHLNHLLRDADRESLDAAYQVVANDANNSQYAHTHEPLSAIAGAFQAEQRRRMLVINTELPEAEVCMGCSTDLVDGRCPNTQCTWTNSVGPEVNGIGPLGIQD